MNIDSVSVYNNDDNHTKIEGNRSYCLLINWQFKYFLYNTSEIMRKSGLSGGQTGIHSKSDKLIIHNYNYDEHNGTTCKYGQILE